MAKFQDLNDSMGWGFKGKYRFFRAHTLRKFHASNIGLTSEYVDALQGRAKDEVHETYIKTNPKDTLVALKDVPLSLNQVREDANKNLNSSLGTIENNGNLDKNMTTIINVLSKILEKNIQVQLPPQTRSDLDILMSGGMI